MSQPHELELLCNELELKFQGVIVGDGSSADAIKSNFFTNLITYFIRTSFLIDYKIYI